MAGPRPGAQLVSVLTSPSIIGGEVVLRRSTGLIFLIEQLPAASLTAIQSVDGTVSWSVPLEPTVSGSGWTQDLVVTEWYSGSVVVHTTDGVESYFYVYKMTTGELAFSVQAPVPLTGLTGFGGQDGVLALGALDGDVVDVEPPGTVYTLFRNVGCTLATTSADGQTFVCSCNPAVGGDGVTPPALPRNLCGFNGALVYNASITVDGDGTTGVIEDVVVSPSSGAFAMLVVTSDADGVSQFIVAVDISTGEILWRTPCPWDPYLRVLTLAAPPPVYDYFWIIAAGPAGSLEAQVAIFDVKTGVLLTRFSFAGGYMPSQERESFVLSADGQTAYLVVSNAGGEWLVQVLDYNTVNRTVEVMGTLPGSEVLTGPAYLAVGPFPGQLVAASNDGVSVWRGVPFSPSSRPTPTSSKTGTSTRTPSHTSSVSASASFGASPSQTASRSAVSASPTPRTASPSPAAGPGDGVGTGTVLAIALGVGGAFTVFGAALVFARRRKQRGPASLKDEFLADAEAEAEEAAREAYAAQFASTLSKKAGRRPSTVADRKFLLSPGSRASRSYGATSAGARGRDVEGEAQVDDGAVTYYDDEQQQQQWSQQQQQQREGEDRAYSNGAQGGYRTNPNVNSDYYYDDRAAAEEQAPPTNAAYSNQYEDQYVDDDRAAAPPSPRMLPVEPPQQQQDGGEDLVSFATSQQLAMYAADQQQTAGNGGGDEQDARSLDSFDEEGVDRGWSTL